MRPVPWVSRSVAMGGFPCRSRKGDSRIQRPITRVHKQIKSPVASLAQARCDVPPILFVICLGSTHTQTILPPLQTLANNNLNGLASRFLEDVGAGLGYDLPFVLPGINAQIPRLRPSSHSRG